MLSFNEMNLLKFLSSREFSHIPIYISPNAMQRNFVFSVFFSSDNLMCSEKCCPKRISTI